MSKLAKLPEEKIEPEVLREMTIPLLEISEADFEPYIKTRDLKDFSAKDQKMLALLSIFEQKTELLMHWGLLVNRQARALEAELIRQKIWHREQAANEKQDAWKWGILKWLGFTIGSGIVALLLHKYL